MCRGVIRKTIGSISSPFCVGVCEENGSVGREPPFSEEMNAEAEESPLLEADTRKRLVNLAYTVVICKVWRSAMAL
jgi:hypothetical protein